MAAEFIFESLAFLGFGFVLGIRHAFDADHVVAISSIVMTTRSVRSATRHGVVWGVGHTLTLFLVGAAILFLKVKIPETVSLWLEGAAGLMLVVIGIRAIRAKEMQSDLRTSHHSLMVGAMHGLAGSGALTLLVLASADTLLAGMVFILLFGVGSILAMMAISSLVAVPLAATRKMRRLDRTIRIAVGALSVVFGGLIIIHVIGAQGLL